MHPGYNGLDRYDLAVVTLTADIANATWYGINTGTLDETSTPGIKVGYGYGGDGANGTSAANMAAYPFGTKRVGVNAIDFVTERGEGLDAKDAVTVRRLARCSTAWHLIAKHVWLAARLGSRRSGGIFEPQIRIAIASLTATGRRTAARHA